MEKLAPQNGKTPIQRISGAFEVYEEDESHKGSTQEELADKSQEDRPGRVLTSIGQAFGIV